MLTYIAAQYLLVTGVLGAPGARPGPPATYRGDRTVTT